MKIPEFNKEVYDWAWDNLPSQENSKIVLLSLAFFSELNFKEISEKTGLSDDEIHESIVDLAFDNLINYDESKDVYFVNFQNGGSQ